MNVNFNEISEMASKQFSLEPGLSNLNETGRSLNQSVSQVDEASKKDLEDLFQDFYDEYFDSSKIMKSSTSNVETPINEEVFHEVSESFQRESSSSSLNDDVQQSLEEVILPTSNTQLIPINMVPNGDEVGESYALSKPVTSNTVSTPQESKGVNNDKVIAPGMFRINPFKTSREEKHVPNTVSSSARTKPITVSQTLVFTKKDMNSDLHGLSSTGVDNTKTRRPQPRSNTKHDRVPSASKSSRSKNKEAEVEEHHRNLLLSKNNKHISSACNNIKNDSQDVISKVVCAMCKKCSISINHDECLCNYMNGKNSHGKKQKAKVSFKENQKKYQPKVTKLKKVGFLERLATPKPRKPRFLLRWSPTGRLFDQEGNIVDSSESKSQSDCSNGDNACTSNILEPKIKRKSKASNQFRLEVYGTVHFGNDHVAGILGFGDLQWEIS
nr:hypothetical protein [Tanacetum cinerariifolium]